ncbi:restriction endonuclease subunit S [Bifidobacterium pseudocatenulatum]|nr:MULTISPECIES: restriction endonuclease subunit S [Bifidobacterium]MCG4642513.1 restriction endonuclease subunit S [Bifidobacterium pseudocatenulatum]MCQ4963742.1 restriction endonuclease subunit S [Bifidobacterium pseudocatenulatum]MCQ4975684.1 restriction endonuclease subunit S [Bifidobacterium pseudocatenulatum]MCQ5024849.1 restriction endonuclease subunit S [Bifidobacterium adolescentis]
MVEQHEKTLVPQIRFAGFTDPWEQRKLENYVVVSTTKNVDGKFGKEDVLSVSGEYGVVNQITFQGRSFAGASVSNYGVVNTGDVVYTKSPLNSNPYGIIKVNKGIPGIVSTLYAIYHPRDNVYANFIQVYFEQHKRMNNYMHPLVNKGAKNDMKVTAENALKGMVTFPSREEQSVISAFFSRLDSLITLHQRKYDKLCVLKKSMLDKMFPKGGSLYPEIRFSGFTDPWEQRKLGELFEESDERASDREILSVSVANGIYPASESDRETNPGASLANYKIVHFGDVVYNSMRMWQGAVDASRYDGIVSPAYVVARPNSEVYARFFARLLRQPMLLKQYQQVSQGNSKDTQVLKFDDFASIGISMPVSENEQRQIGGFFDRLDSLITLHQRKLELLRNIKKSMLDKMFV